MGDVEHVCKEYLEYENDFFTIWNLQSEYKRRQYFKDCCKEFWMILFKLN